MGGRQRLTKAEMGACRGGYDRAFCVDCSTHRPESQAPSNRWIRGLRERGLFEEAKRKSSDNPLEGLMRPQKTEVYQPLTSRNTGMGM